MRGSHPARASPRSTTSRSGTRDQPRSLASRCAGPRLPSGRLPTRCCSGCSGNTAPNIRVSPPTRAGVLTRLPRDSKSCGKYLPRIGAPGAWTHSASHAGSSPRSRDGVPVRPASRPRGLRGGVRSRGRRERRADVDRRQSAASAQVRWAIEARPRGARARSRPRAIRDPRASLPRVRPSPLPAPEPTPRRVLSGASARSRRSARSRSRAKSCRVVFLRPDVPRTLRDRQASRRDRAPPSSRAIPVPPPGVVSDPSRDPLPFPLLPARSKSLPAGSFSRPRASPRARRVRPPPRAASPRIPPAISPRIRSSRSRPSPPR